MIGSNFKKSSGYRFDTRITLNEIKQISLRSAVNLYFAELLLVLAVILILLNNLNVIAPGTYFGVISWVTIVVFSVGVFINFFSIPFLYFSSLKNFKKDVAFWDKELFWILPLFFFGTFFLYNSNISSAVALLTASVVIISIMHVKFFIEARKIITKNAEVSFSNYSQYFDSLKYLTAYYILLLILLVTYNPLKQLFIWIRLNA